MVSHGVTVGIIDILEIIEIQKQQGNLGVLPLRPGECTSYIRKHIIAIRQIGELIEVGLVNEFFNCFIPL